VSSERRGFRVVYAEKSFTPRPAEVTYVAPDNVREYDYYALLSLDAGGAELLIPVLVEDLSTPFEFGGKTAVDRLLGVSAPVVFVDRGSQDILSASRSSWVFPVVLGGALGNQLINELEGLSRRSMYVQIVARDFYDEVAEAQTVYAPTIYLKWIAEPAVNMAENVLDQLKDEDGLIFKNYWRALAWRMGSEAKALGSQNSKTVSAANRGQEITSVDEYLELAGSAGYAAELPDLASECERVLFVFPMFSLANVVRESEILRRRGEGGELHPALATLAAPLIPVVAKMCSPTLCVDEAERGCGAAERVSVAVVHDYDRDDPYFIERVDEIMRSFAEYAANVVRCASARDLRFGATLKPASSGPTWLSLKQLDIDAPTTFVASVKTMRRDSAVLRFSQLKPGEVRELVEMVAKTSGVDRDVCAVFVVRDTEKVFLDNALRAATNMSDRFKAVYFVYAPEATPVHYYALRRGLACTICNSSVCSNELVGIMEVVTERIVLPLKRCRECNVEGLCRPTGDVGRFLDNTLRCAVRKSGNRCDLRVLYPLASSMYVNVFAVRR